MIRVILPHPLSTLAKLDREIRVDVAGIVTQRSILDAVEAKYPQLIGTIRDRQTKLRRPLVRFFVCETDVSHESPDVSLPEAIASGAEPFYVIGAIAGG
jgi:hypothetical protein